MDRVFEILPTIHLPATFLAVDHVSVLCVGLESFPAIVEQLTPEQAGTHLGRIYSRLEEILVRYNGEIVDYWDGNTWVLFGRSFSVTNPAMGALRAAWEIYNSRGDLSLNLGLATGKVIVGLSGGEDGEACAVWGEPADHAQTMREISRYHQIPVLVDHETLEASSRPSSPSR
ncbi:MAG: hypothetical protein HYU64_19515 [Armatimonadetes bacterium]|nr:hypothetical protein [Armatimonadota bacterium]